MGVKNCNQILGFLAMKNLGDRSVKCLHKFFKLILGNNLGPNIWYTAVRVGEG